MFRNPEDEFSDKDNRPNQIHNRKVLRYET